jgi:hypothetical protein
VIISGNVLIDNFALYRLEYGQGLNPTSWTQLGGDHTSQVDRGPMEFWDTANVPEGLYTLQLSAVRHDQSFEQAAVQVTVDNTPPEVTLLNPPDGKEYKMEDDEWVNIQVDAVDNVSMDRVEVHLDGYKIDEATVTPYSTLWTIVMSDTIPVEGTVITQTETVTSPEGIVSEQVITLTEVVTVPNPSVLNEPLQYVQVYSGGLTIISDTTTITPLVGYTETHVLKIIAFDAAGNKTESETTSFHVIHDPEALEEDQPQSFFFPIHHSPRARREMEEPATWFSLLGSPLDAPRVIRGTSPPG